MPCTPAPGGVKAEHRNSGRHTFSKTACTNRGKGCGKAVALRAIAKLRQKRQKLLDLYLADKITADFFSEQETQLTRQIDAIEGEVEERLNEVKRQSVLADHFKQVAPLLREVNFDAIWNEATDRERKLLVNEVIESVTVQPDRLQMSITAAPTHAGADQREARII